MDQPSQGALFRNKQDDRKQVHRYLLEQGCGRHVAMLKGSRSRPKENAWNDHEGIPGWKVQQVPEPLP